MATQTKRPTIEIKEWQNGIGLSPLVGFGAFVNCDLSKQGVVRMFPKAITVSGVLGLPLWGTSSTYGNWILSNNGKVYNDIANIGDTTTAFDITNTTGTTYRYTFNGTGTNPLITLAGYPIGSTIYIQAQNFSTQNKGTFIITGAGLNYFEITNASGVAEANKTIGTGYISKTISFAEVIDTTVGKVYGQGQGLAYYKDYIYVARETALDRYQISTKTWTNNWQTLTKATFHPMIVGQDDILYIGNGNTVASLNNTNWNASALDLTATYEIRCLEEYGVDLMIGTVANIGFGFRADIFPWDRTSPSFKLPIRIGVNGVYQMKNFNNILYITAGTSIYTSNGSSVNKVIDLRDLFRGMPGSVYPATIFSTNNTSAPAYPGAITVMANKILFGFGLASSGDSGVYPFGVFSYENGRWATEVISQTGIIDTSSNSLEIGLIFPVSDTNYYFSYKNNSTSNLENVKTGTSTSYFHSNYETFFESPMYGVGFNMAKFTFQELMYRMSKKLLPGQGFKIKYRTNLSDDWTLHGEYTYENLAMGSVMSHAVDFAPECEFMQLRVEFKTSGTSPYTPELNEILII